MPAVRGEKGGIEPLTTAPLPTAYREASLVDLLDRVLDKGVVINADIIVSVAGIPLIGINLRAALAGMDTMLKYGFMRDWDERSRDWERRRAMKRTPSNPLFEPVRFQEALTPLANHVFGQVASGQHDRP